MTPNIMPCYYRHKETQRVSVCITIQGPDWILADMETGECVNVEKTKSKEEWEEIPAPYPCQKPDDHLPSMMSEWHTGYCLICKRGMEESE